NDRETKTVVKDPERFRHVRAAWELLLTGCYSVNQAYEIVRNEWSLTTPRRRRIGGQLITRSYFYTILRNPFYAGMIVWDGVSYMGKNEPMVTLDEFERVQQILGGPGTVRPQKHTFAFTGMIRCGACGLLVTAEHKINRFGSRYTYYHCTRRRLSPRCEQPSIELRELEEQMIEF